jgi:putative ABC transport system ATP-binding protein
MTFVFDHSVDEFIVCTGHCTTISGATMALSAAPTVISPHRTTPAVFGQNLTKIYGTGEAEVRALDDVTVSFDQSQLTAIMGPSGSGKSTLLHCLAGLDRPTSGRVVIDGQDLSDMNDKQLTQVRRERIGFIFQAFNLVPTLTALENILLPSELAGTAPDTVWLNEIITTIGLAGRVKHRPSELSGGQQQRVAVARALVTRPSVIFADEPTGNLDSKAGDEVLRFLRWAVRQHEQSVIMVTHDPHAASFADRVVFLVDGQVVDEITDPTTESVLARMNTLGN